MKTNTLSTNSMHAYIGSNMSLGNVQNSFILLVRLPVSLRRSTNVISMKFCLQSSSFYNYIFAAGWGCGWSPLLTVADAVSQWTRSHQDWLPARTEWQLKQGATAPAQPPCLHKPQAWTSLLYTPSFNYTNNVSPGLCQLSGEELWGHDIIFRANSGLWRGMCCATPKQRR